MSLRLSSVMAGSSPEGRDVPMDKAQEIIELSLLHIRWKSGHKYSPHFIRIVGGSWSISIRRSRGIGCSWGWSIRCTYAEQDELKVGVTKGQRFSMGMNISVSCLKLIGAADACQLCRVSASI